MHSFISFLLYYLSFRILKRNFNRLTLTLSLFYFLPATGFILNLIFLLFSTSIIGYILYFAASYLILCGFIFLIVFIINLLNLKLYSSLKKQVIIILSYAVFSLILLLLPGGITINESTGWTPIFSWPFSIIIYIFFTLVIFIPSLLLTRRLYKTFEDKTLKKKLGYFSIGIIGMFLAFYGLILYLTWYDAIFRTIWAYLVFFIVVPSGILIYYGIGHNL